MLQNPSTRPTTPPEPAPGSQNPSRGGKPETEPPKLQAAAQDARLIERLLLSVDNGQLQVTDARRVALAASFVIAALRELERGLAVHRPCVLTAPSLSLRLSE
jgi:hypothetical protein